MTYIQAEVEWTRAMLALATTTRDVERLNDQLAEAAEAIEILPDDGEE